MRFYTVSTPALRSAASVETSKAGAVLESVCKSDKQTLDTTRHQTQDLTTITQHFLTLDRAPAHDDAHYTLAQMHVPAHNEAHCGDRPCACRS